MNATSTRLPIEVILDLREFKNQAVEFEDLKLLWDRIEFGINAQSIINETSLRLQIGDDGFVELSFLRVPSGEQIVSRETSFAIHGVVRRAQSRYRCGICAGGGSDAYGPFRCEKCEEEGGTGRVCDQHVVILEGTTQTSCERHTTKCACGCGQPATFRCDGDPRRRQQCRPFALHVQHRHPGDEFRFYCDRCFDAYFSPCSSAGCKNIGHLRCEHVDQRTLSSCNAPVCPMHATRWQIWGPHVRGPAYCGQHAVLSRYGIQGTLLQAICGSLPPNRREPALPSLAGLRYALSHSCPEVGWLSVAEIDNQLETIGRSLANQGTPAARRALSRLEGSRSLRVQQRGRAAEDEAEGRDLFARVEQFYRDRSQAEVAAALTYSGYVPAKPATRDRQAREACLFIKLPQNLIGLAVGRGGVLAKALASQLAVRVKIDPSDERAPRLTPRSR